MTTQLGEAQVPIRATTDKLDSDLARARGKVHGALTKLAGGLQTIGMGALGLGGAAVGAIAGIGAVLGKITIDAAPVEGIADAFDGLADSAGIGGDAMLDALQKGSAGMISQRDLMLSFNKAASLVSTDFATQLPDAMQYLSKVAASTGQDMGYLMDSLVVGVGRVSPMILDNLGIQVALSDATARAAEMFGVEAGALTKTQQQAGMMNVVLEKLAANTASMPDVTESAAAKLAQLSAGFQDTKDKIGMAFLPVLTTVLEIVAKLAERVLPPLTDFLEGTLAPAFERVAQAVSNFIWLLDVGTEPVKALGMALSILVGPELAPTIMEIVASVQEFITKAKEILGPIVAWISENVKLEDVLIALGIAVATVVLPALWGIIAAAAPVIGVFVAVIAVVAALRAAWESDFLGIRTALTQFWEGTAKPALAALWQWLQVNVPAALETLRALWVDTVWPAIQTAIETVWPVIETIFTSISTWVTGTLIPTLTSLYDKWVTEVWPTIQTVTENVWTVLETIFAEIGRWINDNIVPWIEALQQVWADTVWPAIQTALETAWGVIEPIWESLRKWLEETLPPALEGLQTTFETIMTGIKTAIQPVKDLWDGFVKAIKTFWTWITSHTFTFKLNLPDLPDWAMPGSPLPIHTAWKAFAEEMNALTIRPRVRMEPQWREMVARPGAGGAPSEGGQSIVIYGLTLEGVSDRHSLLAELQAMA